MFVWPRRSCDMQSADVADTHRRHVPGLQRTPCACAKSSRWPRDSKPSRDSAVRIPQPAPTVEGSDGTANEQTASRLCSSGGPSEAAGARARSRCELGESGRRSSRGQNSNRFFRRLLVTAFLTLPAHAGQQSGPQQPNNPQSSRRHCAERALSLSLRSPPRCPAGRLRRKRGSLRRRPQASSTPKILAMPPVPEVHYRLVRSTRSDPNSQRTRWRGQDGRGRIAD